MKSEANSGSAEPVLPNRPLSYPSAISAFKGGCSNFALNLPLRLSPIAKILPEALLLQIQNDLLKLKRYLCAIKKTNSVGAVALVKEQAREAAHGCG